MNPEVHTLTGAYALDALEPAERRLVDEHLRDCPPCRQEVRELSATASRLALAVAQDPPGELRHRILTEVRRTRQRPPVAPAGAPGPTPGKARRWTSRTRRAATAVAVAASIAVAVGTGALAARNQAELDAARAQLARYEQVASVLAAPDSRATTVPASGGTATLVTSRRLDRALLMTTGLPAPGPARDYQVWLIGSEGPRPAGLLSGGPLLIGGLGDSAIVAVTLERAGGAPLPTTQPILKLELPA